MASFDVESIFANIPLQKTIDLWVENLSDNTEYFHNISEESFRELLFWPRMSHLFYLIMNTIGS